MINELYGFSLSHETISNIVDRVQPRVIEWQNRRLDKEAITNTFPNEMAVMKILYLRTLDVVKKWAMPYPNWSVIRGKLDILWGVGWDK